MRANLGRVGLSCAVALASIASTVVILAASAAARAGGTPTLPPDLATLPLKDEDLVMARSGDRTVLRLSNSIVNRGTGPLEVFPSAASHDCDGDGDPGNDRNASQRLYADSNASGVFEPGTDAAGFERLFGCMRYHPPHDHWHVLGFARYRLRSEPNGRLVATTSKLGFCLGDNRPGLTAPGTPPQRVYPVGAPSSGGCAVTTIQGLSVGWVDVYLFDVPGQALDVGGLRSGTYCLISRTDPGNLLEEIDEANNARRTRIALDPERRRVRKLGGRCRVGD